MNKHVLALLACGLTACASGGSAPPDESDPVPPASPIPAIPPGAAPAVTQPAPWSAPALRAADVPAVLLAEWRAAENSTSCAPLALAPADDGAAAGTPRAAQFSGGWAVAWDLPGQRSAYGVAGTGASATGAAYADWPHRMRWRDGSSAEYGPEGGTGPRLLAYVRIPGQSCLYNVWSATGIQHLEQLIARLRFVDVQG